MGLAGARAADDLGVALQLQQLDGTPLLLRVEVGGILDLAGEVLLALDRQRRGTQVLQLVLRRGQWRQRRAGSP
ncbi:MAG TPA: hypothetical protein VFC82_07845 [Actinomycetaceae bacterium]|nr:hypothetical protein [Actinomycetaceae bacterium]